MKSGLVADPKKIEQDKPKSGLSAGLAASEFTWDNFSIRYEGEGESDYGLAPIPTTDGKDTGQYLGSLMLSAFSGTKHPKEVAQFIDFMVHDPEVGKIMGYDRGILATTEQYDAFKPTDAPNKAIAAYEDEVAKAGVLGTITPHPSGADVIEAAFLRIGGDIAQGKTKPADAREAVLRRGQGRVRGLRGRTDHDARQGRARAARRQKRSAAPAAGRRGRRRENLAGYLFMSPWIAGFLLLTAGPMVALALLRVHRATTCSRRPSGWACDNFTTMFQDPRWQKSVEVTLEVRRRGHAAEAAARARRRPAARAEAARPGPLPGRVLRPVAHRRQRLRRASSGGRCSPTTPSWTVRRRSSASTSAAGSATRTMSCTPWWR